MSVMAVSVGEVVIGAIAVFFLAWSVIGLVLILWDDIRHGDGIPTYRGYAGRRRRRR